MDQALSISKMYALYRKECKVTNSLEASVKGVNHKSFCKEYKLSFFCPKKDQCSNSTKLQMLKGRDKEDFTEEYRVHLKRKEEACLNRSFVCLVKTADTAHSY